LSIPPPDPRIPTQHPVPSSTHFRRSRPDRTRTVRQSRSTTLLDPKRDNKKLKKKMPSTKRKDGPSLSPLALQASSKQRVSELETNAIVDASSAAPSSPSEMTNLPVASTIIHKVDTNFDAGYSTTSASSSSASSSAPKKPHRRTKINMNDMMEVLTPGKNVLSIEYKNVKYTADLTKEVGCGCCGGGVGGVI
jgi:hypothetical protein